MSNSEDEEPKDEQSDEEKLFFAERAKTGRAKCKKCKNIIDSGSLRIAKIISNPFGDGKMKSWHHLHCIFEVFKRQRASTPKIEKIDDMGGYEDLSKEDVDEILKFLPDDARSHWNTIKDQLPASPSVTSKKLSKAKTSVPNNVPIVVSESSDPLHKDNSLRQFRKICLALSNESSYLQKTNILKEFFEKGSDGNTFKGDLLLWCRLLLPGAVKIIYNLQSKQLVKIFGRIFQTDVDEMLTHLEEGDVALTVSEFFQKSKTVKAAAKSILTLKQINEYLQTLSKLTKEDDQQRHLTKVCEKCTANDLQMFVRFVKHDLRINAGPKHILDALHPDAYAAFKTCRDIDRVINQVTKKSADNQSLNISVKLLTPILPMLAEACTSLDASIKKYPNGLYAEIKYDGERVQLHKQGSDFKYFSRSLKPVVPHKVTHFKDYIEEAFPTGGDMILDSEVLMIDMKTGDPLPFGTLGIHKKTQFQDASPCLFIFDCLYYNGRSLIDRPLKERCDLLKNNMKVIPKHIELSESKFIKNLKDLETMLTDVLDKRLEGLVLKDPDGIYEPGKRRWIKVKRDYLFEGKAADTVDLVVLGAFYGTGNKGGMMNVFLMGCYNPEDKSWRTVTKVHGHDDETLKALQTDLDMLKISQDVNKVPNWLKISKPMVPDFVARDPQVMPVWEIACHEFTKHDIHTADGISMRFPRVARVRHDKTWQTATTLEELKNIFEVSKTNMGSRLIPFLNAHSDSDATSPSTTPRKRKRGTDVLNSSSDTLETESPIKKQRKVKADERKEDSLKIRKRKKFPDKPLPDLLAGKIIIMRNCSVDLEFRRHFIGYGATVIEKSARRATHKLVSGSFVMTTNSKNEKMMKIQLEKT